MKFEIKNRFTAANKKRLTRILKRSVRQVSILTGTRARMIPKFGNGYVATKRGEIFSLFRNGKIRNIPFKLKPRISLNGYASVHLLDIVSMKRKNYLVHRLIASTFIGDVSGCVVHHKDGDRCNNKVENLSITNASENNLFGGKTRSKNRIALIRAASRIKYPTRTVVWS